MHPALLLALRIALTPAQPAPVDSVIWLPLFYDVYSAPEGTPTWSSDGEQLTFTYSSYLPPQYFSSQVEILQRDGTLRACLLEPHSFGRAAWSPLGNEIAATNGGRVVVLAPDDCRYVREIAPGRDPSWSRDGLRIAFSDGSITTTSAVGDDIRVVVPDGDQPDWSPDGSSIAFVRGGCLWTTSVDGTNAHRITDSGQDSWPAWSRDGRFIAFSRSDWQYTDVWLVGANGGEATRITPRVEGEQRTRPCWSPDGTRLAYFVLSGTEERVGIGITSNWVPLRVQDRTWSRVKQGYR